MVEVEYLSSKFAALSLNPSITEKEKKKSNFDYLTPDNFARHNPKRKLRKHY
jgi:hypothetical protein